MKIAPLFLLAAGLAAPALSTSIVPRRVFLNGDCVASAAVAKPWFIDLATAQLDGCVHTPGEAPWVMLRAYVLGTGKLGVHWKWIEHDNDTTADCMTDWTLLSCNHTVVETNINSTVGADNKKRWCPLRVFVPEKKTETEGLTWQRCGQCDSCPSSKCNSHNCGTCVLPTDHEDVAVHVKVYHGK